MTTSIRTAFKEWAAICRALATGRQDVILRKGGIVEDGGEFRPDHASFLLLPTFLHQVTNDQRQNKMGAKIHPVGDDDEENAANAEEDEEENDFSHGALVSVSEKCCKFICGVPSRGCPTEPTVASQWRWRGTGIATPACG
jgi:hypothetical protein